MMAVCKDRSHPTPVNTCYGAPKRIQAVASALRQKNITPEGVQTLKLFGKFKENDRKIARNKLQIFVRNQASSPSQSGGPCAKTFSQSRGFNGGPGASRSPLYFRRVVAHFRRMIRCSIALVVLLAGAVCLHSQTASGPLSRAVVLEGNVGYLRVNQADKALLRDLPAVLTSLQATNPIAGLVLDLRFASGTDFNGLDAMESNLEQSKLPLAILVNGQTTGAAARLAEDLREANSGLVFGSAEGNFEPDIAVPVTTNDERIFLKNPYSALAHDDTNFDSSTNLLPYVDIDHTTEADLVREKVKDGAETSTDSSEPATVPEKPFIRDPVLARGVDFIKGLAALRTGKSS
jgi:hypothetical protein